MFTNFAGKRIVGDPPLLAPETLNDWASEVLNYCHYPVIDFAGLLSNDKLKLMTKSCFALVLFALFGAHPLQGMPPPHSGFHSEVSDLVISFTVVGHAIISGPMSLEMLSDFIALCLCMSSVKKTSFSTTVFVKHRLALAALTNAARKSNKPVNEMSFDSCFGQINPVEFMHYEDNFKVGRLYYGDVYTSVCVCNVLGSGIDSLTNIFPVLPTHVSLDCAHDRDNVLKFVHRVFMDWNMPIGWATAFMAIAGALGANVQDLFTSQGIGGLGTIDCRGFRAYDFSPSLPWLEMDGAFEDAGPGFEVFATAQLIAYCDETDDLNLIAGAMKYMHVGSSLTLKVDHADWERHGLREVFELAYCHSKKMVVVVTATMPPEIFVHFHSFGKFEDLAPANLLERVMGVAYAKFNPDIPIAYGRMVKFGDRTEKWLSSKQVGLTNPLRDYVNHDKINISLNNIDWTTNIVEAVLDHMAGVYRLCDPVQSGFSKNFIGNYLDRYKLPHPLLHVKPTKSGWACHFDFLDGAFFMVGEGKTKKQSIDGCYDKFVDSLNFRQYLNRNTDKILFLVAQFVFNERVVNAQVVWEAFFKAGYIVPRYFFDAFVACHYNFRLIVNHSEFGCGFPTLVRASHDYDDPQTLKFFQGENCEKLIRRKTTWEFICPESNQVPDVVGVGPKQSGELVKSLYIDYAKVERVMEHCQKFGIVIGSERAAQILSDTAGDVNLAVFLIYYIDQVIGKLMIGEGPNSISNVMELDQNDNNIIWN